MSKIASSKSSALKNVSILIIDGDEKIASLMKDVLKTLGFDMVYTARDGFEGVQKIKAHKVDFVITDWELRPAADKLSQIPQNNVVTTKWEAYSPVNGASFVRALRHSPHSPNPYLPVIMLVSNAIKDLIVSARDSGVNEVLLKPIIAEDLCDRIIRLIDDARPFVTSTQYKGPCRRRMKGSSPHDQERRIRNVQLVVFNAKVQHG